MDIELIGRKQKGTEIEAINNPLIHKLNSNKLEQKWAYVRTLKEWTVTRSQLFSLQI